MVCVRRETTGERRDVNEGKWSICSQQSVHCHTHTNEMELIKRTFIWATVRFGNVLLGNDKFFCCEDFPSAISLRLSTRMMKQSNRLICQHRRKVNKWRMTWPTVKQRFMFSRITVGMRWPTWPLLYLSSPWKDFATEIRDLSIGWQTKGNARMWSDKIGVKGSGYVVGQATDSVEKNFFSVIKQTWECGDMAYQW